MEPFLQQSINLLISPPGNLLYHLGLMVPIVAALQAILVTSHSPAKITFRRHLVGLGLLLLAQVVLFLVSGFSWQGLVNPGLLPPLDRLITVISLSWIVWLWAFPSRHPLADAGVILLNLAALILLIVTSSPWAGQVPSISINPAWTSLIWELFASTIVIGGSIILLIKRPPGWGLGFGMLILILAGLAAQSFTTLKTNVFWGAVRLAMLAAFPLLLGLVPRLQALSKADVVWNLHPTSNQTATTPQVEPAPAVLAAVPEQVPQTQEEQATSGLPILPEHPEQQRQPEQPPLSPEAASSLEPAELSGLLDTVLASTSDVFQEKDLTLLVDLPERIPALKASQEVLEHALTRLVRSAANSTPEKGIIGILAQSQQLEDGLGVVLLQINGCGNDQAEDISEISSLINAQGGRMWIDTKADRTSTFTLLLPVQPESRPDAPVRGETI